MLRKERAERVCERRGVRDAVANRRGAERVPVDSARTPTDGSTVLLKNVAGGITMTGAVPSASAVSLTYLFKNNEVLKERRLRR